MRRKIVISVNSTWNLINFRSGLIRALVAEGYDVVAIAPADDYVPKLVAMGCKHIPLPMDSKGTHPFRDAQLLWGYYRLLKREAPFVFLGYTVKPNIYGSIVANYLGISVINNIAGLGAVFIKTGFVTRIVRRLYRIALFGSVKVFFQNKDDRDLFVGDNLVPPSVTDLLPGSGIDLSHFTMASRSLAPAPGQSKRFRFLLIGRMLWDKGVGEYVAAARSLRKEYPHVEFCLVGFLNVENPAAISSDQMDEWTREGVVKYLGATNDVRPYLRDADCVVLPSYREGTPRTLLEAAAMGIPIVTTDAVGCREVVDHGVNGYLCKVGDAFDLAEQLVKILELPVSARIKMGMCGRAKVEREFDEAFVVRKYLDEIDSIEVRTRKGPRVEPVTMPSSSILPFSPDYPAEVISGDTDRAQVAKVRPLALGAVAPAREEGALHVES